MIEFVKLSLLNNLIYSRLSKFMKAGCRPVEGCFEEIAKISCHGAQNTVFLCPIELNISEKKKIVGGSLR